MSRSSFPLFLYHNIIIKGVYKCDVCINVIGFTTAYVPFEYPCSKVRKLTKTTLLTLKIGV